MDIFSAMKERRSTRAYLDKPVSRGDIEAVIAAAGLAPSAINLQPWEFVIVKESQAKEALLKSAYYGIYTFGDFKGLPPVVVAIVLKKKYWGGSTATRAGTSQAYLRLIFQLQCRLRTWSWKLRIWESAQRS